MREIKFRQPITNSDDKFSGWHYWGFIDGVFVAPAGYGISNKETADQSQQYTGLKDRNGQEIYEGDILKMNGGAHDFYGTVLFGNGCFVFDAYWIEEGKMKPELYHYTQVKFVDCEVAGNVYQNPELLEAEGVEE